MRKSCEGEWKMEESGMEIMGKIKVVASGPPATPTACAKTDFLPCHQAKFCLLEKDESFETVLAIQFSLIVEFLSRGVLYKITR